MVDDIVVIVKVVLRKWFIDIQNNGENNDNKTKYKKRKNKQEGKQYFELKLRQTYFNVLSKFYLQHY